MMGHKEKVAKFGFRLCKNNILDMISREPYSDYHLMERRV
jgi:hypothetical protein